jgi:hypothetical protein
MRHKVYDTIIKAITAGKLIEPFTSQDFQKHCPGLGDGTYNAFLPKHARGNPGGNSELFERVGPGKFRCLRPFKYGF